MTPIEWAAVIGVVGGVVGTAIGSMIAARISANAAQKQIDAAKAEGDAQRRHDADQRRLDRQHIIDVAEQAKRAEAYESLVTCLTSLATHAEWEVAHFQGKSGTEPGVSDLPDDLIGRVTIYTRSGVVAGLEALDQASRILDEVRGNATVGGTDEATQEAVSAAQDVADAARRVISLLREDLGLEPLPRYADFRADQPPPGLPRGTGARNDPG